MRMTPEEMSDRLKRACGASLRSVILYGSAAAGDHAGARSDYNLLVVLDRLGVEELDAVASVAGPWLKAGNPPPLLFTMDRLRRSADVFPIEMADMRAARRVLAGEDVVETIPLNLAGLRHQLERELKVKLIQLRQLYLQTGGDAPAVADLIRSSLSAILVLFRAALRLFQVEVPSTKAEALDALGRCITFDVAVFRQLLDIKEGRVREEAREIAPLFARYLAGVESVVDAVDAHVRKE